MLTISVSLLRFVSLIKKINYGNFGWIWKNIKSINNPLNETYKSAGVDIEVGDNIINRIKDHVRSTFNANVLTEIGHFGGMFKFDSGNYKEPVLVSSVDGVGTKLKIAIELGKHDTIRLG